MLEWTTQLMEPRRDAGGERPNRGPSGPCGPCFVAAQRGYFDYVPAWSPPDQCSMHALTSGFYESLTVFDEQGRRWRIASVESSRPRNGLNALLACTVFNPTVSVRVSWAEPGPYDMDELRGAYLAAVELDDDSLTQFVETDELRLRIAAAHEFGALADVFAWSRSDAG